jgi:limonene-1,2-epoxide hydrolase
MDELTPVTIMRGVPPHAADRIVAFFEGLQPADLDRLNEVYLPQAWFKDPFNEVRGVKAIRAIFEHMFVTLHEPRFVVREVLQQDERCFLVWDFVFRFRRSDEGEQLIRGATHLQLAPDGRIAMHRDYWDAAEELYEKLPILGGLMRWLKRRAGGRRR